MMASLVGLPRTLCKERIPIHNIIPLPQFISHLMSDICNLIHIKSTKRYKYNLAASEQVINMAVQGLYGVSRPLPELFSRIHCMHHTQPNQGGGLTFRMFLSSLCSPWVSSLTNVSALGGSLEVSGLLILMAFSLSSMFICRKFKQSPPKS